MKIAMTNLQLLEDIELNDELFDSRDWDIDYMSQVLLTGQSPDDLYTK